jgi:outer membrane protein assembly factor BamB
MSYLHNVGRPNDEALSRDFCAGSDGMRARIAADLGGTVYAFDAVNGAVLWQTATGQSMGGGSVSCLGGGRQLIGVAAGTKSPIWPGGSAASQIVVYGLR